MPQRIEVTITSDRIARAFRIILFKYTDPNTGDTTIGQIKVLKSTPQFVILARIRNKVVNQVSDMVSSIDSSSLVNRKFMVNI